MSRAKIKYSSAVTSVDRDIVLVEELVGDIRPTYNYEILNFETAELFASERGRTSFPLQPQVGENEYGYEEDQKRSLSLMVGALRRIR